jgi:hypothetical protein
MRVRGSRFAAAALVLALIASSCGNDAKKSGDGASTTAAPGATTTTANAAADQATAQELVLVQADFPKEWTAKPHQADPSDAEFDRQLAACAGAPDPATVRSAEYAGPDVTAGAAQVSTEVTIVKTLAAARADLGAIKGSKLSQCVKEFVRKQIDRAIRNNAAGASLKSLKLDSLNVQRYGDATKAFRLIATISVQDQTAELYDDVVFLVKGRAEVTATFTFQGAPFDHTLEEALLSTLGGKLESA